MAAISSNGRTGPANIGLWLLAVLTVLAIIDAVFNYFWTGNGIHGTEGALLVIVSTVLQLIAVLLILGRVARGWFAGLLQVLILLDLAGTALAAYLLDAWILLALTGLAFIAWLLQIFGTASSRPVREAVP